MRLCLQLSLVDVFEQDEVEDCGTVRQKAFDSHVPCYLDPEGRGESSTNTCVQS